MIFSIVIHGDPASTSARSALAFVDAALTAGHEIYRVFLYHDAVRLADPAVSHQPQREALTDLARTHGFEVNVCIAAASRRAVLEETAAATPFDGIEVVGLGQLIDAALSSDRLVTFAA